MKEAESTFIRDAADGIVDVVQSLDGLRQHHPVVLFVADIRAGHEYAFTLGSGCACGGGNKQ